MDQRIVLAHDGSINADWVCRYALRMAAALPGQPLPAGGGRCDQRHEHEHDRVVYEEQLQFGFHLATFVFLVRA